MYFFTIGVGEMLWKMMRDRVPKLPSIYNEGRNLPCQTKLAAESHQGPGGENGEASFWPRTMRGSAPGFVARVPPTC